MANFNDYLAEIQAFSLAHEEPTWLFELRKKALAAVDELALPPIERVRYNRWPLAKINLEQKFPDEGTFPIFDELNDNPMVIQQGDLSLMEQLPQRLIDQGVIFTDFHTAVLEHEDLVKEYFMTQVVKADEDKLTALHAAFFTSGVFLYVPKNVVIEEPIEAIFLQDGTSEQHYFKHVLIVAGENSQFNYLERYQTEGQQTAEVSANIIAEVVTKPGAKVKFSSLDRLGKNVTAYMNRRGKVVRDASIDWAMGILNDGNIIGDFDTDLIGDGAQSTAKLVSIASGSQTQAIDTKVTNFANHTTGLISQHGVAMDKATLTFNGIGQIVKGARHAEAQQESRVLMLSDKARGDANPILLIDENEVVAGHAASIGQVDPEDLFYLTSRGLTKEVAERLVIRGFLGSVISEIPVKEVREELVETIEGKLNS